MKTFILAATLALTSFSVFANNKTKNNTVNITVIRAFENEFGKAEDITWALASNQMYHATFIRNGEKINAFFNAEGELIGSTIERTANELPSKLQSSIKNKEKNGVITEAIQMQYDDQTFYLKVYSNGVEKLYKGNADGQIQLVSFK